ncbi:pentapeptide repeat-containing protein [Tardiphaga sp. 37S4]|uniref:pentapeptide repeat-containing protein n=1 Tax=Tardiphaga sp. 37S4 TaxID=1404741 RepID=UPI001E2F2992|nr:pentapeptide repeat-containing protein [Tardiphaga sp. 37S4]UFS77206.1 pentapeptide repeat-containing protein [Tardiphaga sp. 37S4]
MENQHGLTKRIAVLEEQLEASRSAQRDLHKAIENERTERQESLLWQEHRFLAATRNLYQYRGDPKLRWAAVGGLVSAFLGRSTSAALAGGGLFAVVVTAGLAMQANNLLSSQNDRMDVQTVVMDAQRRTQNFQAEYSMISSEISAQVVPLKNDVNVVKSKIAKALVSPAYELGQVALNIATRPNNGDASKNPLAEIQSDLVWFATKFHGPKYEGNPYLNWGPGLDRFIHRLRYINDKLSYPDDKLATAAFRPYREDLLKFRNFVELLRKADGLHTGDYRERVEFLTIYGSDNTRSEILFRLDDAIRTRIAGLSQSVRPYPILSVNLPQVEPPRPKGDISWLSSLVQALFGRNVEPVARLSPQTTSAERGQLLKFLMAQRIYLPEVFSTGADFNGADLSGLSIGPNLLTGADLEAASFRRSLFFNTELSGNFKNADFTCATFVGLGLRRAELDGAKFTGASFDSRERNIVEIRAFRDADFSQARLKGLFIEVGDREDDPADVTVQTLGHFLSARLYPQFDFVSMYKGLTVEKQESGLWQIREDEGYDPIRIVCDEVRLR